jgi:transcriptional regulator with XRE-family HTH domain
METTLNQRVKVLVKNKHYNANSLAGALDMAAQTVFRYLNGENKMPLEFVERLLRQFPDVRAEWLMRGEGAMYNTTSEPSVAQAAAPATESEQVAHLQQLLAADERTISTQADLIDELKKRCAMLEVAASGKRGVA